jgi:hypothetical protein
MNKRVSTIPQRKWWFKMKFFPFFSALFFLITSVLAHGEDKLGPNNGFIRMSGSFHTELVPQMDGTFLIFLLDLQNKNSVVKNSFVDLRVRSTKEVVILKCTAMEDHFHCTNDKKVNIFDDSRLVLKVKRLGIQSKEIVYVLPLKMKQN